MKKMILILSATISLLTACNSQREVASTTPKTDSITIPAKGEIAIWKNTSHAKFTVDFVNNNEKASCEIYKVTKNGKERWINPSLLGQSTISVQVPTDGYVYFKNFNALPLTISYSINP